MVTFLAYYIYIIYYIIYSMLIGPIYCIYMGPSFCVLGCNIALAGSGYITFSDTNSGPIFCI